MVAPRETFASKFLVPRLNEVEEGGYMYCISLRLLFRPYGLNWRN